ncbi:MAG: hypothetical protein AAF566_07570 [Pseudomonadota bacterium]
MTRARLFFLASVFLIVFFALGASLARSEARLPASDTKVAQGALVNFPVMDGEG